MYQIMYPNEGREGLCLGVAPGLKVRAQRKYRGEGEVKISSKLVVSNL